MRTLQCELSGKDITEGYWSPASGFVFDKATIQDKLRQVEIDPITRRPLQLSDLVPINHSFDVDTFAASVAKLYREIEGYRSHSSPAARAQGPSDSPDLESMKKSYEAKLEDLRNSKDEEISRLTARVAELEGENERTRMKMVEAVKKREEFLKRKYDDRR